MLRECCVRPAACGVRRAACWLRVVEGACVCCQWVGDSGSLGTLSLSLRKPSLWRQPRISETSLEARAERGRRCSCASCECVSLRLKRLVADGIFSISECYSIDPDRPHHGAHTCQQCGPRRVDCMRDHEPHGARAQRAVPHDPHDPGSSGRRTSDARRSADASDPQSDAFEKRVVRYSCFRHYSSIRITQVCSDRDVVEPQPPTTERYILHMYCTSLFFLGTPANAVEASGNFRSIFIARRYCFFSLSDARCSAYPVTSCARAPPTSPSACTTPASLPFTDTARSLLAATKQQMHKSRHHRRPGLSDAVLPTSRALPPPLRPCPVQYAATSHVDCARTRPAA